MSWMILCSTASLDPAKLNKDVAADRAKALANYSHAFLIFSPKTAAITPLSTGLMSAEFSNQACSVGKFTPLTPVAGAPDYFDFNGRHAMVVDTGLEALEESMVMDYNKEFAKALAASTAVKKGYPLDCLGYCVNLVKSRLGRAKVAGK